MEAFILAGVVGERSQPMSCANSQEGLSGQEQCMASTKAGTHCFDWGLWRHLE